MKEHKPLLDEQGEVRALSSEDLALFKPAQEVLPASLRSMLGVRGPQKAPTKERICIRLARDTVEKFRAMGKGWQGRIDEALRSYLERGGK